MDEKNLREDLCATAQTMAEKGLSPQRTGNISARFNDGLLITPSAVAYEKMTPVDMVFVKDNGARAANQRRASSETPMHQAIYRENPDVKAIVHCHSMAATALACARREIPAFHYMVAVAGGTVIPLADYATPGSETLGRHAINGLRHHRACLLANHGQIALGSCPANALELAAEIETLAQLYIDTLAIGRPHILTETEMQDVLEYFQSYIHNML